MSLLLGVGFINSSNNGDQRKPVSGHSPIVIYLTVAWNSPVNIGGASPTPRSRLRPSCLTHITKSLLILPSVSSRWLGSLHPMRSVVEPWKDQPRGALDRVSRNAGNMPDTLSMRISFNDYDVCYRSEALTGTNGTIYPRHLFEQGTSIFHGWPCYCKYAIMA
jgi:hypothetical protein